MSTLLLLLLFGVLQVAVYFYARNVAAASAASTLGRLNPSRPAPPA